MVINSLDESDQIKIWNLKSNLNLCSLNLDGQFARLCSLCLTQNDFKIVSRSQDQLVVWNMRHSLKTFELGQQDLSFGSFLFTPEGHFVFCKDDKTLVKLDLKTQSSSQARRVSLPDNLLNWRMTQNGDLLVCREIFSNDLLYLEEGQGISSSSLSNSDSIYTVDFVAVDQDVFPGESLSKAESRGDDSICLFSTSEKVSVVNVVSQLGSDRLPNPEGHPEFFHVTIGTMQGSCFECLFVKTQAHKIEKKFVKKIVEDFRPLCRDEAFPEKSASFSGIHDVRQLRNQDLLVVVSTSKQGDHSESNESFLWVRSGEAEWCKSGFD